MHNIKEHIFIDIQDEDRFFSQGVEHVLLAYFIQLGCRPNFISAASASPVADLIVHSVPKGMKIQTFCVQNSASCGHTSIIMIDDLPPFSPKIRVSCPNILGVLSRQSSPADLIRLVDRFRSIDTYSVPGAPRPCQHPDSVLTPQERKILQFISGGMTPTRIAMTLKMSIKTVSSHKRSSMRKIGIERNSELYQWLRQGGLKAQ